MKNINTRLVYRVFAGMLMIIVSVLLAACNDLIVLHPEGDIGKEEVILIRVAFILMLIVIVPVLILTFRFSAKYKAGSKKDGYIPDWPGSKLIEWVIWLVPAGIVIVLSYLTWVKTFQLDPYKPIPGKNEPVRIEVISLDWRWLFIYPEYDIAAINQLVFPENTPIEFRLTSATVMTSFFIPQLGSQMYAMAGMQTRLHLIADATGTYTGQNQEFSGKGYEAMFFEAKSVSEAGFNKWVQHIRQSTLKLDSGTFNDLMKPSEDHAITFYSEVAPDLFNHVIKSFMNTDEDMKMPPAHKYAEGSY